MGCMLGGATTHSAFQVRVTATRSRPMYSSATNVRKTITISANGDLNIARVKGKGREVRCTVVEYSRRLLDNSELDIRYIQHARCVGRCLTSLRVNRNGGREYANVGRH